MRGDTRQGSTYNTVASATAVRLIFLFSLADGGGGSEEGGSESEWGRLVRPLS